MRSQDEIVERYKAIDDIDDYFGFRRGALLDSMEKETAKRAIGDTKLPPALNIDEWEVANTDETVRASALEDYTGNLYSMSNHRGLSTNRSLIMITEYVWLLGRDDILAQMEQAPYPMYGAPVMKLFAELMGFDWPEDDPILANMANGKPCKPHCQSGCLL